MIARVFPRRTNATPDDELAFIGEPGLFLPLISEVHISVTFTWDLPRIEQLARAWVHVAPVKIGGPATGTVGENFEPGRYLRRGYVITSRGCPNNCWFCSVPRREGDIRELPIRDGWNVLDDNLLACSDEHVNAVFAMCARQDRAPEFTGGLEAARLKLWHVKALRAIHPKQIFFACDTPLDRDPLHAAGEMLLAEGFTRASHTLRAYVLIGWPEDPDHWRRADTFDAAEARLRDCMDAGFLPMAMLYRDETGRRDPQWARFQKTWARPAIRSGEYIT